MTAHNLAVYTFGQFLDQYESETIRGFREAEPAAFSAIEAAPGFISRSGYDSDEQPGSWGPQVFPRFWVDNGDGFAPSTLSLWDSLEAIAAATYHGLHGAAYRRGREWNIPAVTWPSYVLWWVSAGHRPDWQEAVKRHEHLADHGPSPFAFTFKQAYGPTGSAAKLDPQRIRALAEQANSPAG